MQSFENSVVFIKPGLLKNFSVLFVLKKTTQSLCSVNSAVEIASFLAMIKTKKPQLLKKNCGF